MEKELEQPTETCGLMLTFEGGVGVKVNLKATKEEVIDAIVRLKFSSYLLCYLCFL